jgi:hypothetical protein
MNKSQEPYIDAKTTEADTHSSKKPVHRLHARLEEVISENRSDRTPIGVLTRTDALQLNRDAQLMRTELVHLQDYASKKWSPLAIQTVLRPERGRSSPLDAPQLVKKAYASKWNGSGVIRYFDK